jgi:hypothetical protein
MLDTHEVTGSSPVSPIFTTNVRSSSVKAISHARRVGATVAVAKLDRLSRISTFRICLDDGNVLITSTIRSWLGITF